MELITKRFYINLSRSPTPMSNPVISTGEIPPRILPAKVLAAIQKAATAPRSDLVSVDLLRVGGYRL
ncbi:unnamed protein product [Strongylus vulgaris]|uniref:Uncharacterized protein n=1 Tax=Strongylus vulgaris TaxID=40348 RepID=A0A3P7KYT1_STRVU|nr:unnamed protein product [Strongylus vulgaris]